MALSQKIWRCLDICSIALASSSSMTAFAQEPIGLIGGTGTLSGPYAAFVAHDGSLTPLSFGFDGAINSVAINSQPIGLIGGTNSSAGYAAFATPNGALIPLATGLASGEIFSVAINSQGYGVIGGVNNSSSTDYAALVSPNGFVTVLDLNQTGTGIYSVAINHSGNALIGGDSNSGDGYFAHVSPDGTFSAHTGLTGTIFSVAINQKNAGIVGGANATAYFVQANDNSIAISIDNTSTIESVAINNYGIGLLGGELDIGSQGAAYAAIASSQNLTVLNTGLTSGIIKSVAINDLGGGLIGGEDLTAASAYAALMAPDGTLTPLDVNATLINSVALNNEGVGLIGGGNGLAAYAALVAPNGALTELSTNLNNAQIYSVSIIDAAVPKSIGPYSSAINAQLAASNTLETRLTSQNRLWKHEKSSEISLTADTKDKPPVCPRSPKKYNLWAAPFGNYVNAQSQRNVPKFTNEIAGALAAFDYHAHDFLIGCGLGYAFNYIHYSRGQGHGKIQEETACIYSSYKPGRAWFNAALWGGFYQFHNERHTLSFITSKAHTHGWILSPHMEVAIPYAINCDHSCTVEPFLMFDWVNAWQRHYTERGESGFNLVVHGQYASLLQSEAGLRFYEMLHYCWGRCLLEEKLCYANQAPFHFNDINTAFIGYSPAFPVATGSKKVQNLGGIKICVTFLPKNFGFYSAIDLEGLFNKSYQSVFASIYFGENF